MVCRISLAFLLCFSMMKRTAVMVAGFHHPRLFYTKTAYNMPSHSITVLFANARRMSSAVESKERPYRLLIVESPSKCNTIAKILSKYVEEKGLPFDYQVLSCMGHIRDLPQKKVNEEQGDFPFAVAGIDLRNAAYTPTYTLIPSKEKIVSQLRSAASRAERVLLATDPDREGEAMAWHLTQVLDPKVQTERVTFTEITPTAIAAAVEKPTHVNPHLVHAQETRRILDRLAGFTVSPVLWRKIAPGLSAGRVQSVGMALTVRRERERLMFKSVDYASISGVFADENNNEINAKLVSIRETSVANNAKDLENNSKMHLHIDSANNWAHEWLESASEWKIKSVDSRPRQTNPPEPYKTSTLQQDAVRRLGLSVQQTMRAAQHLYEQGLISYMRTDSTHLSDDVESVIKETVIREFGSNQHLSHTEKAAKKKKKDTKFAQEAHEAIRPAIQPDGSFIEPSLLTLTLPDSERSLYQVIYQRTLACRMPPLVTNQTAAIIEGAWLDGSTVNFRASGSVVLDPGFTRAYGRVDPHGDDDDGQLPPLHNGQIIQAQNLTATNHQTQPPPRYTEASFVKELEALGVGRPSTYGSTIQILRDRAYVGSPALSSSPPRNNRKVVSGPAISAVRAAGGDEFTGGARGPMVPSLTAFVVCSLFEKHCPGYVDPNFTARMEERLDQIASGEIDSEEDRKQYLNEFYAGENGLAAQIKRIDDTVAADEARRACLPSLVADNEDQGAEEVRLFVGPWGPYVQLTSSNESEKPTSAPLPAGMATDLSTITPSVLKALLSARQGGGNLLGNHPENGKPIYLKTGRFGAYLQLGDDEDCTTHSLPRQKATMRDLGDLDPEAETVDLSQMLGLTLEEAVGYVGLPRTVCSIDESPVTAAIGPYGPYLKYNNSFVSLDPKDGDVLSVDVDVAIRLVTDGIINGKAKSSRGVVAELGEKEGHAVTVKKGRFGDYLNWKKVNAKLPTEYAGNPSEIPLNLAWDLIMEKDGSGSGGKSLKASKTKGIALPSAPKRPLSAYLHFCAAKRPEVSETTTKLGEISKLLAKMWAELGEDDREQYLKLAATGKEEYSKARTLWEQDCQKILKDSKGSKSLKKSTVSSVKNVDGPKRPLSAYLHFCAAKRPEISQEGKKLGDISKELAQLWAETSDRSKYDLMAEEDKKRYESEVQLQTTGKSPSTFVKEPATPRRKVASASSMKMAKTAVVTNAEMATVRPPSAYMLFCKEVRPQMVDENTGEKLAFGEASKRIAVMWKECDHKTKQKFEKMAATEKEILLIGNI